MLVSVRFISRQWGRIFLFIPRLLSLPGIWNEWLCRAGCRVGPASALILLYWREFLFNRILWMIWQKGHTHSSHLKHHQAREKHANGSVLGKKQKKYVKGSITWMEPNTFNRETEKPFSINSLDWLRIKEPSSCISLRRQTVCCKWRLQDEVMIAPRSSPLARTTLPPPLVGSLLSIVPEPPDNCFYCSDQLPIIPLSKKSADTIFSDGRSNTGLPGPALSCSTWYWWWFQTH